MMKNSDPFPYLTSLLRQGISHVLYPNAKSFLDMIAEDIVFEFPYALPDGVQVLNGKKNPQKLPYKQIKRRLSCRIIF